MSLLFFAIFFFFHSFIAYTFCTGLTVQFSVILDFKFKVQILGLDGLHLLDNVGLFKNKIASEKIALPK